MAARTVLVVDKEASVRTLIREFLESADYAVLEASNGGEAFRVAVQHKGEIHLLLTELVMPKSYGYELAGRLAPWQPEMKVLYLADYTRNRLHPREFPGVGPAILHKPFSREALLERVREQLD